MVELEGSDEPVLIEGRHLVGLVEAPLDVGSTVIISGNRNPQLNGQCGVVKGEQTRYCRFSMCMPYTLAGAV